MRAETSLIKPFQLILNKNEMFMVGRTKKNGNGKGEPKVRPYNLFYPNVHACSQA
jgi:hypothetical protein